MSYFNGHGSYIGFIWHFKVVIILLAMITYKISDFVEMLC